MISRIINFIENSNAYSLVKDFERIFFQARPQQKGEQRISISTRKVDPYEVLKTYNLEMIKGIGPKTRIKLEKFGIKSPYDLINCQQVQGISQTRIETWKQIALSL